MPRLRARSLRCSAQRVRWMRRRSVREGWIAVREVLWRLSRRAFFTCQRCDVHSMQRRPVERAQVSSLRAMRRRALWQWRRRVCFVRWAVPGRALLSQGRVATLRYVCRRSVQLHRLDKMHDVRSWALLDCRGRLRTLRAVRQWALQFARRRRVPAMHCGTLWWQHAHGQPCVRGSVPRRAL